MVGRGYGERIGEIEVDRVKVNNIRREVEKIFYIRKIG